MTVALENIENRSFLFLQGPHGPFFHALGKMLRTAGARVWRVGFNAGDRAFWPDRASYIAFCDAPEAWNDRFDAIVAENDITDVVLYGDIRPLHAQAVERAKAAGLTVHIFEEGYLRPYWVSYERGGSNGFSALMDMSVAQMKAVLARSDHDNFEVPSHWGDLRHHVFYGALYHWFVIFRNGPYAKTKRHRELPVTKEFYFYLKRLCLMPLHWADRVLATRRVRNGGYPYHLALLQLEHDASFQAHSRFETMPEFVETVIEGFANGAPRHHHLVFKAHPLEMGRRNLAQIVAQIAQTHGVAARVHYIRGGKLAQLLDHARSAVTVNSTAGQQVLWRGLPLKVFGDAVYAKREFVSTQPLEQFFAAPARPNSSDYRDFRQYLLETSQIAGGFYSASGRRQLLRQVVDMMLAPTDPYTALERGTATPRPALRAVT